MSQDIHQLKGLTHLAGLAFRAAQSDMAALLRREADLRRNLAQLTESKAMVAKSERPPNDAALIAGADIRWHHWVDQRRATINSELAQVLAQKENCRARLRTAFGKDQAAKAVLDHARIADRVHQRRRDDYES